MPKNVFWPATLVVMGFIFLASNLGMLPKEFWNFWPLILIIVGLGGLLTSDREEWLVDTTKKTPAKSKKKATARKKKPARKKKK
ncbi:MAG: hypothetical protein HN846_02890 [Candidatus Pacebacteria bacterium]|jgi:hypothetical protein|nr:hypothetical protein [Candidatus Paceibacterota bacterium]MBT3511623.1 hypothetical protein [Candidatus Paceibacterota bacterium]MBT4004712.1 hypothetical protein [Candidatus Paceibacterota bacterium]MBT4359250.1 hypothetical protein [Candidatus Paceibacterota bacterium]MBT4681030.1 hypothetical protein [Candidatus Paceibacterota bacterium]